MSKKIIACKRADPVDAAEKLMQVNQVRRLPVLDADEKLVGILSLNDIARFARTPLGRKSLYSDGVGSTLAAVCTPRAKDETAVA
jgi:CBS-domain-containing membrane protein